MNRAAIANVLRRHAAELLRFPVTEVATDVPLLELGADSLIVVEMIRRVREDLDVQLTVRQLFEEFVTLDALTDYLVRQKTSTREDGVAPSFRDDVSARVAARLVEHLATLLRLPVAEIAHDLPLLEMGADSLIVVEMIRRVEQDHQVKLTVRQLFEEFVTVEALSSHIASNLKATPEPIAPAPRVAALDVSTGRGSTTAPMEQRADRVPSGELESEQVLRLRELMQRAEALLSQRASNSSTPPSSSMRSAASASMVAVSRLAPVGSLENAPSRTRATPGMGEQRNLPPLRATRAFAARLVDATGREFVDMSMGGGCHLFGHRPAFLQQALEAQLDRGMHLGPVGEQTHLVAEAFCALTRMERATFANSYAEALMTALRLCRASTGRSRVIVVRGAAAAHLLALENRAHGVAWDHGSDSELVDGPSGALQALRWRQDVAAIVLDGAALTADEPDLMALRDLAARERACLVVDERTTLFRVTLGGVNQALGLNADLVVHSGALSDGLPCAVLAGRASILDHVDGGWAGTPGGESLGVPTTYTAGTYCRNPLSMAASLAVLQAVVAQGEAGSRQLMNRTLELLGEMNSSFARAGVAVRARLHGGGIRLVSMDGGGQVFSLVQSLRSRGVHWDLTSAFLSSTHTDSDLNLVADAVDVAAQELASSRYLSSRGAQGLAVVNAR